MAHLWLEEGGIWTPIPLQDDHLERRKAGWIGSEARGPGGVGAAVSAASPAGPGGCEPDVVALVRATCAGANTWVLVTTPEGSHRVRVNGVPLRLPLRVLADRDELAIAGTTGFFSTETLPAVAAFQGDGPAACPRCKTRIAKGAASVRCPGCGTSYHQSDDRPCWVYGPTCPLCGRATALDQSYSWTPADL
jgi:hypothetical protein